MDGRIYDPVIGRFLSADPFVQDPANSQSLNRYSYCINNPLAFTDPTGFSCWRNIGRWIKHNPIVRIAIGVVVGVALGIVLGPAGFAITGAWLIGGAAAGVVSASLALASGVGLKQALFEGAAAFAITSSLLYNYGTSIGGLLGGGGGAASHKGGNSSSGDGNPNAEKPKDQAEAFPDQSSHNSKQGGMPPDGKSFQDSVPGYASNRASGDSNFSNAASSAAYQEMFGSNSNTVEIDIQRIAEGKHTTLSSFTAIRSDGKTVTGYMLERGGPSSLFDGSQKRIPAGIYNLDPYSGSSQHQNQYILWNEQVHKTKQSDGHRNYILIHPANFWRNIRGCLAPGSAYDYNGRDYSIPYGKTHPVFNELRDLIGNNRAKVTIRDIGE